MKTTLFIKEKMTLLVFLMASAFFVTSCNSDNKSTEEDTKDTVEESTNNETDNNNYNNNSEETAMPEAASATVYNITQVDSPPLFDAECRNADNPAKCSEDKILAFIKKNAQFPKAAANKGQEGLEQVIFVVQKDGSLANVKYVASSDKKSCDGCQQAAVDVIGKMTTWVPAQKDGNPVAVQMTIPVRFRNTI